jgi:molecular chaperone GrpE
MSERRKQAPEAEEAARASSDAAGEPEAPVSGSTDEKRPAEGAFPQQPPAGKPDSPPEPSDSEAKAVETDLDELLAKARERDEYLSLAQRTQADFENYRKRAAKDLAGAEARGVAKLARELLPALDNLHLALAAVEGAGPPGEGEPAAAGEAQLAEGIRLVAAQLTAALARLGIEAYSPEGEPFDPSEHEAMAKQPVEGAKSGTVVEVYQQGYRANGSVLRPARVVVAE